MKSRIVTVLLLALMAFSVSATEREIRVGVGLEFADIISPEHGRLEGELAEPYSCLLNESGFSIDFVVLPLARLVHELRLGNVTVGLPLVHEPSRDEFATLGDTVIDSSYLRVSLPSNTAEPDAQDVRYAYIRGFAGKTILKGLGGPTYAVSSWEQAIEMLRRQRADFVLITQKTFGAMTANSDERFIVEKVRNLSVAFYVSNDAPEVLKALNAANARCRK